MFLCQAEDGIRYLVRSRGLGDVYKRQGQRRPFWKCRAGGGHRGVDLGFARLRHLREWFGICLLYTSDAADERSSVDLGGRRIIKKKREYIMRCDRYLYNNHIIQ
mgnify:CR=1 FL=1